MSGAAVVTVRDALVEALGRAARYNPHDAVAPAAVLWPDGDGLWGPAIADLRPRLPLLTLGGCDPAAATGPT